MAWFLGPVVTKIPQGANELVLRNNCLRKPEIFDKPVLRRHWASFRLHGNSTHRYVMAQRRKVSYLWRADQLTIHAATQDIQAALA